MLQAGLDSLGGNTLGQLATKLMGSATRMDDEKDLEEDTYQEQESEDEEENTVSLEIQKEDESLGGDFDSDAKEEVLVESEEDEEEDLEQIEALNEQELVNSATFGKVFESAIEHISEIAKAHRAEMIESIVERIEEETGEFVDDEMMSAAMKTFAVVEDMDIESSTDVDAESEEDDESAHSVSEDDDHEPTALESQQILRTSSCWKEAMDAVRELAQEHQPEFVDRLCAIYEDINDEEPTIEEVHDMFIGIKVHFHEEAVEMVSSVEDEEDVDAETLAEEMELALVQVRKQAELDQEGLVDFICEYYSDFNGIEPSIETISGIFERIKEGLAEDAREEFLDLNQDGDIDDGGDSDYETDGDSDAEQYAEDESEDVYIDGEHEAESEFEVESEIEIDEEEAFDYLVEIEDEEELVNDPVFGELWCSAMEHVASIGHEDGVSMVLQVLEQFEEETGQDVTEEMIELAMNTASTLDDDAQSESEDEEELAIEMMEAVQSARELGALHQEQLVHQICDLFAAENGEEPSLRELYSMFGDVQQCFAEEDVEDLEDSGETNGDSFAAEWQSAMDHIQIVAEQDREEMVNALCDIYCDHHGAEPTTPALYEMFAEIKASFAEEAADDLVQNELSSIEEQLYDDDDSDEYESEDDSDYSPDSDAFDYALDSLDDVLFHDSEYDEEDSSDSDYVADQDAVELTYSQDEEDDLASSTEEEVGDEDEQKASELESDSEYSPDKEAVDYYSDYEAEHIYSTSSSALTESESESESEEDMDYIPEYDLFDYSLDSEPFQKDKDADQEYTDESDDGDYSAGKDQYDYTQDVEDDFADESEDLTASGSGAEEQLDSELAA